MGQKRNSVDQLSCRIEARGELEADEKKRDK
jgi:hypothetical protein